MISAVSRIKSCFEHLHVQNHKALIAYITAGDPCADLTLELMLALVSSGTDIIELGVPFSDPMADGPIIQRAAERALCAGTGLVQVFDIVRRFRACNTHTPVVLMGYTNPIERYAQRHGASSFAHDAAASGVDGVLVVDCPPEESVVFAAELMAHHLDPIFLLAPTSTDERMQAVARVARGYVYYVSLKGVTGAGHLDVHAVVQMIPRIKAHVKIPVGVGFGIRDAQTAAALAAVCDGVVIGSSIVELIEQQPRDQVVKKVSDFVKKIREALNALPESLLAPKGSAP
jgi:tryptophan synthase alpha chain